MAKILFINPVIRENEKPAHVPFGMAQLVAICVRAGHQVQVFDANAWRPTDDEILAVLKADEWRVVAIGGLVTTYGFVKKVLRYVKKACPQALTVAGGGFLTPIPHEVMALLPEIDLGVIGEGYVTLPDVLARVDAAEEDWHEIPGLIYRDRDGVCQLTAGRPLLEEVDTLPFPAWDLFPLDIYFRNSGLLLSEEAMLAKRHLGVIASYGCPYRCKYCFHLGLSGEIEIVEGPAGRRLCLTSKRKVRAHSPEYVVAMVAEAKKRFGIDFVSFLDENFAVLAKRKKWFDTFRALWVRAGLRPRCITERRDHDPETCGGIHWGTTAHPAVVTPELLRGFKELGCAHLDYGLESFSDAILTSIDKGSTAKLNAQAVIETMKAGIRPIPNQIIGFPEESFDSIRGNVVAWKKLGIRAYPFFATPYPGSEWYSLFKEKILAQYDHRLEDFLLDLGDATKITAVISSRFNAVELLGLRELMVNLDLRRIDAYERQRESCSTRNAP